MYKIDVEYMKIEDKFAAILICSECDKGGTTEIFKHAVPDPSQDASLGGIKMIGQQNYKYIALDNCMTEMRDTLVEVEYDVHRIIKDMKTGIEESRKRIVKSEEYNI